MTEEELNKKQEELNEKQEELNKQWENLNKIEEDVKARCQQIDKSEEAIKQREEHLYDSMANNDIFTQFSVNINQAYTLWCNSSGSSEGLIDAIQKVINSRQSFKD